MEMKKEIKVGGGGFSPIRAGTCERKKLEIHSISKALMPEYLSIKIMKFKSKKKK